MRKPTKTCSCCKRDLPLHKFNRDRSRKDGLDVKCKDCQAYYYQENRERIIARTKKWQAANPDKSREYYERNKTEINRKREEYRKAHQPQETARIRAWQMRKRVEAIAAETVQAVLESADRAVR